MISCTDFIPAYSELFKYLDERGGREEVRRYWAYISDNYVKPRLGTLAAEKGIMGCWEYWNKSLNEEAADFEMAVDESAGRFELKMRRCPSKSRLTEPEGLVPYADYCGHCDLLYRRVLEPLGYTYDFDMPDPDGAACSITVTKMR